MTITRKTILTAAIIGSLALTGLQIAGASPGGGRGHGDCGNCPQQGKQLDEATQQARTKFLDETVALRKQVAEKRTEMRVLMDSESPDAKQTSSLAGELFDLREQLRVKAQENGLPGHGVMGEMGMNQNCGGMGMKGPHHGRFEKNTL